LVNQHEEFPVLVSQTGKLNGVRWTLEGEEFLIGRGADCDLIIPDRQVSRQEVVENVWPESIGAGVSEQAIDALIRRLRDRLDECDPSHSYIVTVRGHGFRLDNPV
jgi:DNA-binding response OmpR family regulator